jgi:hypothetical protein
MSADDAIRPNSERRYRHLAEAAGSSARWTRRELVALLASHEAGICQHGDRGLWTIASIVLAPRERRVWVADGPPCRTAFEEIVQPLAVGGLGGLDKGRNGNEAHAGA